MKKIKLTQNKYAVVDDEDFNYLNQWKWYYHKKQRDGTGYAARDIYNGKSKKGFIFMHRLINKTPDDLYTDHINSNKLDNRKCNLRTCSRNQNLQNRSKIKNKKTSKYKGVYKKIIFNDYNKSLKFIYYDCKITFFKNKLYVGNFKSEYDAAIAYDFFALMLFGEFANTNFKEDSL